MPASKVLCIVLLLAISGLASRFVVETTFHVYSFHFTYCIPVLTFDYYTVSFEIN